MPRFFILLCLSVLCAAPAYSVEQFSYKILNKKPQDRANFVQGLEILEGTLYVSCGNYGQSRLMRYHFDDMRLKDSKALSPRLFAEGLSVLGEHIYQLTWRERMMLVFNKSTMEPVEWFPIVGQGWGLTNDGTQLIYSDGSDQIHFLSNQSRAISHSISVTENGRPVRKLNELEWIDGKIWANVWQTDRVVIINPQSGEVEGNIDLSGLLPASDRHATTDVLNGIARNPDDGSIWVTGKRWPWLYQIELLPLN
jgi:glutamine cyclotransferase